MSDGGGLGKVPTPVLIAGGAAVAVALVLAARGGGGGASGLSVVQLDNGGTSDADAQLAATRDTNKAGAFGMLADLAGVELTTRGAMHLGDVQAGTDRAATLAALEAVRAQSRAQVDGLRITADAETAIAAGAAARDVEVSKLAAKAQTDAARMETDAQRYAARAQKEGNIWGSIIGGVSDILTSPFKLFGF